MQALLLPPLLLLPPVTGHRHPCPHWGLSQGCGQWMMGPPLPGQVLVLAPAVDLLPPVDRQMMLAAVLCLLLSRSEVPLAAQPPQRAPGGCH
jgi:hypothetical protein